MVRYRITLFFLIFCLVFIIGRLFYWQVVRADELSSLGQLQYGKLVKVFPSRGEIKTADGFPIATNKVSYTVFANPKEIKNDDKEKVATLLSPILQVDIATISAKLSKNLFWVPLKRNVKPEEKDTIEKSKLTGIGFEQQSERFYPEGSMAAQLVGFVGKTDEGEDKGYFGLEGYYDRQLKGKETIASQIHDAFGRPILAHLDKRAEAINGRTLTLGIDRTVQFITEKKLSEGIEKYGASGGMVIIMDPKTGNLLGMSSFPSFDQRNFNKYDPQLYKNPIVSNIFEPGSTFKALIMAAGIDAKVVKPQTKCPICEKPVEIGGYEIKTWNNEYIKDISMVEVIQHSDNTGMVYVGQSLGLSRMLSYFKKFGIGDTTGIDLQGEVAAYLRPENEWRVIDLATASFGQGISVTPIELLTSFSALANEGKRMEPHVVTKIETGEGKRIDIKPKVLSTPVSATTAKIMTEILVNAVDKGEAKWAKPKGYRIAGKTGTAQIPIAGHYDPNKTIASFIGFAPADNPKFSMLVVIDRPTTSIYGADTAAPIFFQIARDLLGYYAIVPTE